jgi:adenylate kinase
MVWSSLDLVFLGPPGSGKGTQARLLAERYSIPHISTGDLLRNEIEATTPIGRDIEQPFADGAPVPDRVVSSLVLARLDRTDSSRGFLLDGYPRSLDQAALLDRMLAELGRTLERVVLFEVDDEVAIGRLMTAPDGHSADVARRRVATYREHAAEVAELYRDRGLLLVIDAGRSRGEVSDAVLQAIGAPVGA